ncbi:MAG: DUF1592 domain-containing protein [Spirochaetia bacterium]|nr:DUF1592 domain-containing protein [Spirochaetia bacterium]
MNAAAAELPVRPFLESHCFECHDSGVAKGGLDLGALKFDLEDAKTLEIWVKVHDRVQSGEMPPAGNARPGANEIKEFLSKLSAPMIASDLEREKNSGRAAWRRLNRYEYEATLRDILQAPWLQIKDILPEDGEAHLFNKVGTALDYSHVQMAQYMAAADYAIREVIASRAAPPEKKTVRYYARDQRNFAGKMKFNEFNKSPERATFPVLGTEGQPDVRSGKDPITVGAGKPEIREKEAMGVVASSYEPIELRFDGFAANQSGRYKVRLSAYSVWVGPGSGNRWWVPDLDKVSPGRRGEPIAIYSEKSPRIIRRLGSIDVGTDPTTEELDVYLLKRETIRVDASRFFRSRPPAYRNPLAERDGQPGVAFRWLEVEGPLFESWPPEGHQLLFGDLAFKFGKDPNATPEFTSRDPAKDSENLLRAFVTRVYRRPVGDPEVKRFLSLVEKARNSGSSFTEAMITGYTAVLCSPSFVTLEEKPGHLDAYALASRLSYFLWNSEPDAELRDAAAGGTLDQPKTLRAQTERLLKDPKSRRFVNACLDSWLDLRKINANSPDATLYPDYYLDELLVDSAVEETQFFVNELIQKNLPAKTVAASDFAMLNERLALHYGLPKVEGVQIRRVKLPPGSERGGLLTQASVLKVTANGTTTSPVVRGAWVMERILGKKPPPPPPNVPAIEPDTRGATTIREQLEKHRQLKSCAACHTKIDPAGLAMENFDVLGGWRDQYRALGDGTKEVGFGKNGQPFAFHLALNVDPSGTWTDGKNFGDIKGFKKILLADERQLARNLVQQLVVYATGAAVRFGDRPRVEKILDKAAAGGYGVRNLIHEVIQSELFQNK